MPGSQPAQWIAGGREVCDAGPTPVRREASRLFFRRWESLCPHRLACGIPAIATEVGGIPEALEDACLGILLRERSTEAAAAGVVEALLQSWDQEYIRRVQQARSWDTTAQQVGRVFQQVLGEHDSVSAS